MEQLQSPFVFLSYATPDRQRAREIHRFLEVNGINVWIDEERLDGGQPWKLEIQRAVNAADLVVLLISPASMERNGFYHREMGMVLENAQHRPHGRVFPIPVLLDAEMEIPERLAELHCIRLAGEADRDKLLRAVRRGLGQQEASRETIRRESEIDWSFHSLEERWEGLPGYDAQISWPRYTSSRYRLISHASDAIRAEMQLMLAGERAVKLAQQSDAHSFGQDRVLRTNALSVTVEDPVIQHHVLTQYATVYGYWAGAIHGFHAPRSWVFLLEPLIPIARLEVVFREPEVAFAVLQAEARTRLLAELEAMDPSETDDARTSRTAWIDEGTADWDAFGCFGFEPSGLGLRFAPYCVAAYAFGTLAVRIPYGAIEELLRRPYSDALGLRYGLDDAGASPTVQTDAGAEAAEWPPPSGSGQGDWWK